jgi:hypothetical protein
VEINEIDDMPPNIIDEALKDPSLRKKLMDGLLRAHIDRIPEHVTLSKKQLASIRYIPTEVVLRKLIDTYQPSSSLKRSLVEACEEFISDTSILKDKELPVDLICTNLSQQSPTTIAEVMLWASKEYSDLYETMCGWHLSIEVGLYLIKNECYFDIAMINEPSPAIISLWLKTFATENLDGTILQLLHLGLPVTVPKHLKPAARALKYVQDNIN